MADRESIEIAARWARYADEVVGRNEFDLEMRRGEPAPHEPFVYVLMDGSRARYVGQTLSLGHRLVGHKTKEWTSLRAIALPEWWMSPLDLCWLHGMEALLIERFDPDINRDRYCAPDEIPAQVFDFVLRLPDV